MPTPTWNTASHNKALTLSDLTFDAATVAALVAPADHVNVKTLFNVTGDGVTDDTVAIQAAIDAATVKTTGPVELFFPAGTYMVTGKINLKTNVRLRGASQVLTILKSTTGAATQTMVEIIGTFGVAITDLTIDANNRAASIGASWNPGGNTTTPGGGFLMSNVTIKNTVSSAFRISGLADNAVVENCTFDTCTIGVQVFPVAGQVVKNHTWRGNTWNFVGTNNLQYAGNNQGEFQNVLVEGNTQRNYQNVGANGPIPMELWGIDNLRIVGNACYGGGVGTRGIGFAKGRNVAMIGNTVQGMISYGCEISNNNGFTIADNTFKDCAEWIDATAAVSDGVISGNVFSGTGRSAITAGNAGLRFDAGSATRVLITDNVFNDWPYLQNAVKLGVQVATDCVVSDNIFLVSDSNSGVGALQLRRGVRVRVINNRFTIAKTLATPGGTWDDDISDVIQFTLDALSSDIVIEGNEFFYTGSFGTVTNHAAIGPGNTGAAALPGVVVRRNRIKAGVRGLRLSPLNSADQIVMDNDTRGCLTADSFNAALLLKRTALVVEGTAAPTTGAWLRGDRCVNSSPAVASPKAWSCTVAGSPGTWVSEGNL